MKTSQIRRIEALQSYTEHLANGLVATDGGQYTGVVTFGTTATEVFNKLVDPGFGLSLKELEVGLTQKFEGLNGSFVGSISYYWQVRPEYVNQVGTKVTGTYINIAGTYTKGVGTLTTSEDTFSGYIPVGSVPNAPVRARLMAQGLRAAVVHGKIKNNSYVRMIGIVIPGT